MDKSSSVIAAFEAGKLPSTQQFNAFVDWLRDVGITQVEPSADGELSKQGRVLADDFRLILDSYKQLANNKNSDNILQQAIFHLTEGDLTVTNEAKADKDKALQDINNIRAALRNLLSTVWSSVSSEGSSVFQDLLSIIRLSIADAAEVVEGQADQVKQSLRSMDKDVQEGNRDALGRDKKRLEEESKDTKVAWQHGMDTVKNAGTSVIGAGQSASATVQDKSEKTSSRLQDAYYKICDRAQSDPQYRQSIDTLFEIIQTRLNQTMDAASDPNTTLSSFVNDPTPEQHIPKALGLLRQLVERLANTPLEPLIKKIRACANSILQDKDLKSWFDEFIANARQNLSEPGYARSEEAQRKRKDLRVRWKTLLEKDDKWKAAVNDVKEELVKVQEGLTNDEDLNKVKEAHAKLGSDISQGLIDASAEATTGMQAAIEQATWFWQDLFKVYVPRMLAKMQDVPIPRTEYKDDEIEFVLENLDISSFNILPSHVYIRNITDIDITTSASPSTPSRTAVGALTHIRIQALQLALHDVSFWYKDKTASTLAPSEFTGLLGLKLPEKGIDVDLKVRLIPATATGNGSRDARKHFNVVERVAVSISDDVGMEVRESNHSVLMTLFKPIMVMRLREALEKTLTEQLRAVVEWADGVAYDVGKRREVFEDTGLGGGGSLVAAIWSEVGRLQRESRGGPMEVGWHATGTGVVVEQKTVVGTDEMGEGGEVKRSMFAMGAEPQILGGEKRGPLGTGSEPLREKFERGMEEVGVDVGQMKRSASAMDVDVAGGAKEAVGSAKEVVGEVGKRVGGLMEEGKKRVGGFRRSVERKRELEVGREGWESASFDF
ncbi:hypothetical protein B0H34DRAFT_784565 [Crassisporium funariophilum]|nr:hypothetical protein B0H34DRAFT_784565 [Crassisporium funariophilum]